MSYESHKFDHEEFKEYMLNSCAQFVESAEKLTNERLPRKYFFYLPDIDQRIDKNIRSELIKIPLNTLVDIDGILEYLLKNDGFHRNGIRLSLLGKTKDECIIEVNCEDGWSDQVLKIGETYRPFILLGLEEGVERIYGIETTDKESDWLIQPEFFATMFSDSDENKINSLESLLVKLYNGYGIEEHVVDLMLEKASLQDDRQVICLLEEVFDRTYCDAYSEILIKWSKSGISNIRKGAYATLRHDMSENTFLELIDSLRSESDESARYLLIRTLVELSSNETRKKMLLKETEQINITRKEQRTIAKLV